MPSVAVKCGLQLSIYHLPPFLSSIPKRNITEGTSNTQEVLPLRCFWNRITHTGSGLSIENGRLAVSQLK